MQKVRRIAVTGASGYLGRLLVDALAQEEGIERILGIDARPMPGEIPENVAPVKRNVTEDIADLLMEYRIEALAHLAFVIEPDRDVERALGVNVGGTESVLSSCEQAGVRRLLYLSSATVYGAHPDNPAQLTEESPLRAIRGFHYGEAKVRVEQLLTRYGESHTEAKICVLRACPVLGASADNFVARNFSKGVLVAAAGYDPPMQFLHEDDAAEVMTRCLLNGVEGTYNVGGRGVVRWSEMARIAGRWLVRVPSPLLSAATELSWRLRLQSSSAASGLEFIKHPWVVSSKKLERVHGLKSRRSSREAWEEFVSGKSQS